MNKPVTTLTQWAFLILMVLCTVGVTAQVKLTDRIPLDPKVKTGVLPNGLKYYIRQNKKPEQKVELRLVLNAGSIQEDDDQQGLAHMGEHMAFNGTKHFKKNEIVSFLQNIGVGFGSDLNAYTSFDETVYILPIPTDKPGNLESGFQILEDWAHNVSYLDEDINNERNIIIEEGRQGKNADERMFKKIYPELFAGSKYANRLPIGKEDLIRNFPTDAIRRFYKEWYRPNLMAVVVVGDVDPVKAEALVKKHFTRLVNPAKYRKRDYAAVPAYTANKAAVITDKEATTYTVSVNYSAFKTSPMVTVADYRKEQIKNLFSSMISQRLGELTQKENPPFLMAQAGFGSYARGYDAFGAYAAAGTGDVKRSLTALTEELERIKRFGFTAAELERTKKNILTSVEAAYNNRDKAESGGFVDEYVKLFLQNAPSPGIVKEFEYIKSLLPGITIEEVNKFSEELEKLQDKYFVYVTGPESASANLPTQDELLAIVAAAAKADVKPYQEKELGNSLIKELPAAGKVTNRTTNATLGTTELTLSNGITVTLKSTDFKNDQVLVAGTAFGGKNNYGLADKFDAEYFASVVPTMGIGEFSPTDLRKVLAGKTAGLKISVSGFTHGLGGSSTVKDLETLFQLIYLQMTAPRKDMELFNSFIQRNKSQFANLAANPEAAFADSMYNTIYQRNPLAPIRVPKVEYFDKINLDRCIAIYKELFGNAAGMHFVFTGSFKESDLTPFIEQYLASLPVNGKGLEIVDNKVRVISGEHTFNMNKGTEQKSLILAFYTGETPYSPDMNMKVNALSEVLNLRIIEELREKIQGIYGGGSSGSLEKYPYNAYSFMVQLPCGPDKADTLVKALKKEIADLVAKPIDNSYLDKVKKQWIEGYKASYKENGTWLSQLMDAKLNGGNMERFLNYEKLVNALTVADVQEAAKLVFGGKNEFFAILMPEN
ncbi:MAG: M16 family metallopeptidase [Pseudobacter sp.]|uniref:M16 family metallopeptidase n=1 Tax=Pseudobacter sp. TaxID=2045420 RepID=UPI003F7D8DD1